MNQTEVLRNERTAARVRTRLNAILCALLVAFCVLLTHPVVEMGICDDWSYARTAIEFARTGHFVYNGWATAILGWQVIWGALFIKVFGFSFTVLRLSTLPISMGSVYLFHQILIRSGVNTWNAIVGSLTLGLSPLFLVLTTSYMTDIPGLFCILLCLYLCQRALLATDTRSAIVWLSLAALSNVVGGTVRQIAWLGALVMIPSTAWLLRGRRGLVLTGALLWIGSVLAIFLSVRWFYQQPYALHEQVPSLKIPISQIRTLCVELIKAVVGLLFLCVPLLIAFVPATRRLPRRLLVSYFGVAAVSFALCFVTLLLSGHLKSFHGLILPLPAYSGNNVDAFGMMDMGDVLGVRPGVLPARVRDALLLLIIAATLSLLVVLLVRLPRLNIKSIGPTALSWHQILVLMLPWMLGYSALLLPRALGGSPFSHIFDRYLLALMAGVTVLLLRFYQERVRIRLPVLSLVTLSLFALWGIAATHDLFSLNRARVTAAEQISRTGVPRVFIQAGFEYDSQTQLDAVGHSAYAEFRDRKLSDEPDINPDVEPPPYAAWYSDVVPALDPKYFLVMTPQAFLDATSFPPVLYRTWLPPFGGTIYVQQAH